MLTTELIDDPAGLERWSEAWDRLAVELSEPCSAPGWMLPWWRHAVPGRADLRSVVVHDGDELVGIAPYFVQHGKLGLSEYRIMGAGEAHRIGPLAKPGREADVAAGIAETLAAASPRPASFLLEGIDSSSSWGESMRAAWPGSLRPRMRTMYEMEAPTLTMTGTTYEDWFASRSSNFRGQMRRKGRQLESRGGQIRLATTHDQAFADLEAMFRMHRERWSGRGLEGSLKHGTEEHLREVVEQLLPEQRARLWTIEADGVPVCVQLFIVAGGELNYWGGGFEPDWEDLQPGQLTIRAAVEDSFQRGESRMDFGGGALRYKWRFSNGEHPVAWISLLPYNARYPLTRAQYLPKSARRAARSLFRRLPEPTVDRIRRMRGRVKPS